MCRSISLTAVRYNDTWKPVSCPIALKSDPNRREIRRRFSIYNRARILPSSSLPHPLVHNTNIFAVYVQLLSDVIKREFLRPLVEFICLLFPLLLLFFLLPFILFNSFLLFAQALVHPLVLHDVRHRSASRHVLPTLLQILTYIFTSKIMLHLRTNSVTVKLCQHLN